MRKRYKGVIILLLLTISCATSAQFAVEGIIRDSVSQEVLPFANIIEIGTTNGTTSDLDGKFMITVSSDTSTLDVTYVGYKPQIIKVKNKLDIFLKEGPGLICGGLILSAQQLEKQNSFTLSHLYQKELTRDMDLSIVPSLNQVAGVHMQNGTLNTNRISIRGIGSRSPFSTTKMRAYFNDIPLTSGDGETTIEDIDMSLIDHVEILKGPTASQYGAGLGGMIHLKSQQANGHESYFQSNNTIGSYGLLRTSNTIRLTKHNGVSDLRINFNKTHNNGYRDNNEYDRSGMGLIYNYVPSENQILTVLANYVDVKAFIPSSININDYNSDPSLAAGNWAGVMGNEDYQKLILGVSNQYRWAKLGNNEDLSLTNTSSIFSTSRKNLEVRPFNILDEESYSYGLRSRFDLQNNRYNALVQKVSIGIELFNEDYDWSTLPNNPSFAGEVLSDNNEKRLYGNAFFDLALRRINKLKLDFGLNVNKTSYTFNEYLLPNGAETTDHRFNTIYSPRIGINYQLQNQGIHRHYIFANISHGFSPISLEETLNPDGSVNPDIQVERGWSYELGLKGHNAEWDYDISMYHMVVTDLLVARRNLQDQYIGINAGKSIHQGIELGLKYTKYQSKKWRVIPSINYTYAHHRFAEFIDEDNDYSGNALTGIAPHNLNIILDVSHQRGLYGNINFNYLSAMPLRDDNSIYSDPYQLSNVKLGYQRKFFKCLSLDISGGIRNILNEHYAAMVLINAASFGQNLPRYYYPGLPRNYYGSVMLKCDI